MPGRLDPILVLQSRFKGLQNTLLHVGAVLNTDSRKGPIAALSRTNRGETPAPIAVRLPPFAVDEPWVFESIVGRTSTHWLTHFRLTLLHPCCEKMRQSDHGVASIVPQSRTNRGPFAANRRLQTLESRNGLTKLMTRAHGLTEQGRLFHLGKRTNNPMYLPSKTML